MAMGVQHNDDLDAIQKTGMQTISIFSGQFSTKPNKPVCYKINAFSRQKH